MKTDERSDSEYPLTPLQEGMLFHSLYARQSGVDISQIICDWQEEINASLFSRAWQQVAERHSILRTRFSWGESKSPRQQVRARVRIPVRQEDWGGLSGLAQEDRLEALLQSDRQTGFELSVAPLMRVSLLKLGQAHYQFVWTIHHLLVDSRTVVILLNELFVTYQSLPSGEEPPLKPAPAISAAASRPAIFWWQRPIDPGGWATESSSPSSGSSIPRFRLRSGVRPSGNFSTFPWSSTRRHPARAGASARDREICCCFIACVNSTTASTPSTLAES